MSLYPYFLDIDECSNKPCHSNPPFDNTVGSYMCACAHGYSGDDFNCIYLISYQENDIITELLKEMIKNDHVSADISSSMLKK